MSFLKLFKSNLIIGAHRGARAVCPENTMSALKAAVGKCDFIELDVQLSRDGIAVVMHDETLERTTNVNELDEFNSRKPYRVCDFTFEELNRLDYGSWFYKEKSKKHSEPLLTLCDTLKFIKENLLYINIEIKDVHSCFSDELVVDKVLKEIESSNTQELVLISSFRTQYLLISKAKQIDIPTALLVYNKLKSIKYLKSLKIDAFHINDKLAEAQTINSLKKAGFFINVYTVDNPVRVKELFKMDVNGVFKDNI